MNEVAQRYSEALFSLAIENDNIEETKQEVESLLYVLKENPELLDFFRAIKVSKEEKKNFIEEAFAPSFSRDVVNFLKLLIDKGRISYLKEMLRGFIEHANNELGIQEALVYSARKLAPEDMERIQKALETKTKKTVAIKNEIDESLIAGIKVVVGNNITDVSMKHKLEEMKKELLKEGGLA